MLSKASSTAEAAGVKIDLQKAVTARTRPISLSGCGLGTGAGATAGSAATARLKAAAEKIAISLATFFSRPARSREGEEGMPAPEVMMG
ncbi:MAG: hypothetical protein GIW95_04555 [Candidatus Eremiobacteraeota bacterium]|nr:hypothetical protein [Candidatus Eremiobacteraeota bacterium]